MRVGGRRVLETRGGALFGPDCLQPEMMMIVSANARRALVYPPGPPPGGGKRGGASDPGNYRYRVPFPTPLSFLLGGTSKVCGVVSHSRRINAGSDLMERNLLMGVRGWRSGIKPSKLMGDALSGAIPS
ncbi:hypothetical protein CEXT_74531 [Caerostris extrusa]|uniref:Uncharacterized protein n=1 Tax=Caerostris extrusa TaxID=172846 RepID=A0AAV4T7Q0_CAEEX|nr:hypothetical protein CEXT_74531 [Caerostris extrusa]